ncbi:MAG: transglycosylase domain-containing protein [Sulfuriferula sp.]|nr:transglycosylase domain-containing protein [Sulfuriferula sp.]
MRTSVKVIRYALFLLILSIGSHAYAAGLPSFEKVQAQYRSSYATLLDRNGEALQTLQLDPDSQRLPWVTLQDLSPAMQNALLVSEDRRFYQHEGVDWRAIAGAAWENLLHNTHRGASTLTMQLAGLLDPSLTRYAGGRTYIQKWQQIRAARQLERHWSKSQILEAYLNLVDFRSNLYGINAAASAIFNKTPAAINPAEASILAALLRGPNAKAAIVAERACGVAALLHSPRPDCADITALSLHQLPIHPKVKFAVAVAPEAALQLLHTPGQRIISSLDMRIQNVSLSGLQKSAMATTAAAIVLDNNTGEILAYANIGNPANTVIDPHAGNSLLQPFVYELAIEQKLLTAATLLDNAPLPVADTAPYPDYMANSPVHDWVSVRTALHAGLNAPALRASGLLLPGDYNKRLHLLGLHSAGKPDTLLAIANAYQALAAYGAYHPASFHVGGLNKTQHVMSAKAAAIIDNILSAQDLNTLQNETGATDYYAVVANDQYAAGFTANYTIALWISQGSAADTMDAWKQISSALSDIHPALPPVRLTAGLIARNISFIPPVEPPRDELFLPGTEQTVFSPPSIPNSELSSQPYVSYPSIDYQGL